MISFCKCLSSRYLQSDLAEMWGLFYMKKKNKKKEKTYGE